MQPVQFPGHPYPGLVRMRDRSSGQMLLDLGLEVFESFVGAGQDGQDGAGEDRQPEQGVHGLGQALGRQVLVGRQVGDRRPHLGPVDRLGRHALGCRRRGSVPAAAHHPVQAVLGHLGCDPGQVEDLPGPEARTRHPGQIVGATAAHGRTVIEYHVRVGDLLQPSTGITLGSARLATAGLPQRLRRGPLPQPVTGRRLGGVTRTAASCRSSSAIRSAC